MALDDRRPADLIQILVAARPARGRRLLRRGRHADEWYATVLSSSSSGSGWSAVLTRFARPWREAGADVCAAAQ